MDAVGVKASRGVETAPNGRVPGVPVEVTQVRTSRRLSGPLSAFASLRHRDYRYLWVSTLFLSAGQWIQQVTLGWLLYELTGSAVLLGALHGLRALPFLIAGPIAGVAADRMDRRKLMMGTLPVLMTTGVIMGTLVVTGRVQVWHIFAFTLVTATVWAFNNPIRQTLVPNVVPRHDLMNAIALTSAGFNSLKVLGPAIGGLMIVWFGGGSNFYVEAVTYGCVLLLFSQMRVPPTPAHARQTSVVANFKEGFAYIWRDPVLLGLMIASLVPPIFSMPVTMALLPVFQKDVLEVGPEGLGLLMAGPGLGAVIATLTLATIGHRIRRQGLLLLVDLALLGLATMLFSQMPTLPLAFLALVVVGLFQMAYFTISNTMLQTVVPDSLRGRVNSIFMADHGIGPAGSLAAGISTQFLGAPTTVAIFGSAMLLLALVLAWRVPRLWQVQTN